MLAELAYTLRTRQEKSRKLPTCIPRSAKASKGNLGFQLSAAQALFNLGESDAASAFLERAQQLNGNNYRLHAIQGADGFVGEPTPGRDKRISGRA